MSKSFERQALAGILLGLSAAACGQEAPVAPATAPNAATPTAAQAVAPAPAPDPHAAAIEADAQLNEKLGKYISDCLNRFNDSMGRSRTRYYDWVEDEAAGPTGRERSIRGTGEISGNPAECRAAIVAAAAMPPADQALHAAATAYITALETAVPLINDANRYYEQENYRDDSFAKGKEMHAPLVAAYKAFDEAQKAFTALVDAKTRELTERRIVRLSTDPSRALEVNVERSILLAQDLIKATENWTVEDRKLAGIELESFTVLVNQYEAQVNQLRAASSGVSDPFLASAIRSYVGHTDELLTHAKGAMRRVRDAEAFSTGELATLSTGAGAWMVDGAPAAMLRSYNDLVGDYNRIRWPR